ncbi:MAG: hypothetical protein WKF87_15990 [Chryseolinea sp.]
MFIKFFRYVIAVVLAIIIISIVVINLKIHYQPEHIIERGNSVQYELVRELRGLKRALNENADVEMQKIYPEGYVFLNATYALAWSSFLSHQGHQNYLEEGHTEISKAWDKINSETGKSHFTRNLPLPYGSFYNGWSSYVLACKLRLEMAQDRSDREILQFKQQCNKISDALQQTTYPESYDGAAWPADVMVCVASLCLHDQLFEPQYKNVVRKWLPEVMKRLDNHGMIPHSVHPHNGMPDENSRGSSMSLILIFLHNIDNQFVQEQFLLFKESFVADLSGLTGILEYAKRNSGRGDIDSGPVFLGFGSAATIVGMQTLSIFGAHESALKVRNAVEAFSLPVQREDYKHHFFGKLPIADAFITWSHSGMKDEMHPPISFVAFHLFSLMIVALLSLVFWIFFPKRSIPL